MTTKNVDFDWTDYAVFSIMLGVSVSIGIYFGCFGNKQKTVKDYVFGGKNLNSLPVALSLVSSTISGVTMIGVPAEVYTEDIKYIVMVPAVLLSCVVSYFFMLPVFIELNITSIYEYLELRYNRKIRLLISAFGNISYIFYLPFVIYIPSIAISRATGIEMHKLAILITTVCIFYTTLGGLKAVVWNDFIQTILMFVSYIIILIIGTNDAGGLFHVFKTSFNSGKLDIFDFDPNPFQRATFWTVFIGCFVNWTYFTGVSPETIQRFMSLSNPKQITGVMMTYWLGVGLLTSMSAYGGLLMFTSYYGCDPIKNKDVLYTDQMFPYYVLDKIGHIPFLPGLFFIGILSAALSSLSTGFNTIPSTIYQDFIKNDSITEKWAHIIIKILALIIATISLIMVLYLDKIGRILSACSLITSITSSPTMLLFTLGMLCPKINIKGAVAGTITSVGILAWITIGVNTLEINKVHKDIYPKDVQTCLNNSTWEDLLNYSDTKPDDVFFLYNLSYTLYITTGVLFGSIVGIIVSYLTDTNDISKMNPKLIAPPIRKYFFEKVKYDDKLLNLIIDNKLTDKTYEK